ncbi:uncharacterized protein LOC120213084 isoform X1 [Hibiscus syriacus]|uniref:uncharacterized protein LOC120213084 isoform X1 n=1 Tax=Hibiscus syriacus TaxID=106335 RepID=UPI0019231816|nr:uncharacterized protein LOC120213084 isoform X1 [Hibiscus syriacus]
METPSSEELLRKIQVLEAGHAHLKQEISILKQSGGDSEPSSAHKRSHSTSPRRPRFPGNAATAATWKKGSASFRHSSPLQRESRNNDNLNGGGGGGGGGRALERNGSFGHSQYFNIFQSLGQSVHIFDLSGHIIYWNELAEKLYGYSEAEALGQDAIELLVDHRDFAIAHNIVLRVMMGESWTGQFPFKNKMGESLSANVTKAPFYDGDNDVDDGSLVGIICVSSGSRPLQEKEVAMSAYTRPEGDSTFSRSKNAVSAKLGLDDQQPLQAAIASKITNLVSKVSNKMKPRIKTGENCVDREGGNGDSHCSERGFSISALSDSKENAIFSGASTPKGELYPSAFGVFFPLDEKSPVNTIRDYGDEREGKPGIQKIMTLMGKKGISWPWKGNDQEGSEAGTTCIVWPGSDNDQENESFLPKNPYSGLKPEGHLNEGNIPVNNEASSSWSSSVNVNSTSSVSSFGSTSSIAANRVDMDTDSFDYEILWEDLTIGEKIGQGSCGTVYHGLWFESDVAIKVFSKQEYSEDVIHAFRQEVSLMKRLRHPNVLLFMGVVVSSERLCILTEFLPRGSLFDILQKNTTKLGWRRRVNMALDIARGMNYLHNCNPPIIHRDLKSSNLLVDKNWTVKVGDFGLSRLKHETYLSTMNGKGTPQWMAPEVLRSETSDEKSDVYSFGVILWELATEKIPWGSHNSMQLIGAVGFMNQRLEIPKELDPRWASMIESCWHSDPECRPTFQELLNKLRDLQRQYTIQVQQARSVAEEKE